MGWYWYGPLNKGGLKYIPLDSLLCAPPLVPTVVVICLLRSWCVALPALLLCKTSHQFTCSAFNTCKTRVQHLQHESTTWVFEDLVPLQPLLIRNALLYEEKSSIYCNLEVLPRHLPFDTPLCALSLIHISEPTRP
eukprot:14037653-Ditylum_brightwellii.AAC.1